MSIKMTQKQLRSLVRNVVTEALGAQTSFRLTPNQWYNVQMVEGEAPEVMQFSGVSVSRGDVVLTFNDVKLMAVMQSAKRLKVLGPASNEEVAAAEEASGAEHSRQRRIDTSREGT